VVCVVYAVDDEDTLDSVTDHWLPLLRLDVRHGRMNYKDTEPLMSAFL
jgi:hypothetical protein